MVLRSKGDDVVYPVRAHTTDAQSIADARLDTIELSPRLPMSNQTRQFRRALHMVWEQGGWTVVIDETFYLHDRLKLGDDIDMLLTQGRSKAISVVAGMQRPVRVTRFALAEATHVISFAHEGRDVKILDESINRRFADTVSALNAVRHEFAWYHRPTKSIWTGRIQDLTGGKL